MGKFCILRFMDNYDNLVDKAFLLKNKKLRDVYIKKFNPFKIESITFDNLLECDGFLLSLPMTYDDAIADQDMLMLILQKTINFLKNQNVNIILYDKVFLKSDEIYSFEQIDINLFFIKDILNKVIKYNNFARRDVTVSVLTGNYDDTCILLNEIYSDLNFVTLVNVESDFKDYEQLTDMIFCDCGLEISFSKNCYDSDIIINLSDNPQRLIKNLNKNAVLIDLVNTIEKGVTSNNVIKNINYKISDSYLKDYQLELILYSNFVNYRKYKNDYNKISRFAMARRDISDCGVKFNNYKVSK